MQQEQAREAQFIFILTFFLFSSDS